MRNATVLCYDHGHAYVMWCICFYTSTIVVPACAAAVTVDAAHTSVVHACTGARRWATGRGRRLASTRQAQLSPASTRSTCPRRDVVAWHYPSWSSRGTPCHGRALPVTVLARSSLGSMEPERSGRTARRPSRWASTAAATATAAAVTGCCCSCLRDSGDYRCCSCICCSCVHGGAEAMALRRR